MGEYNNPNAPGGTDNYFWIFNDGTNWNPSRGNSDFDKHYYSMDFAKAHREIISKEKNNGSYCTQCTKSDFPSNWPGIHMRRDSTKLDNNNWWYFELSGVADPGKALIMFTDCPENDHAYGDWMENSRYPKKEQPGVALFDYPTKEGWFVYNSASTSRLSFLSEDPGDNPTGNITVSEPALASGNQRLYFENLENWSDAYIWGWKDNVSGESRKMTKLPTNNSWFYIDIPKGTFTYLFFRDSDQHWNNKRCENITLGNADRYYFNKDSNSSNNFQTTNRP